MTFCTAINYIDGRTHLSVISYLTGRFNCMYVDIVAEPGPNRILAEHTDSRLIESIRHRVDISIDKHDSQGIAVGGHADCAGNPTGDDKQRDHTIVAVKKIRTFYPSLPVVGLWVNSDRQISEIDID